jgi:hypothetical protein
LTTEQIGAKMKDMIVRYGLVMSFRGVPIVRNLYNQYETGTGEKMAIFDNLSDAIDYMFELAEDK